tara:strand:+ start:81 stop:710 length:630 start_codon:yes stop_codon:yes gene_type:complete
MHNRVKIINTLIEKYNYKTYLEIGIRHKETFNAIKLPEESKECIDPNYDNVTYKLTSDEAFKSISTTKKWDIVFIDGLHEAGQVFRDVENSLKHLNENGTIICHDMLPPEDKSNLSLSRYGNGWEAYARLKMTNKNLQMYVVNTDCGCAVIRKGKQRLYVDDNFNHDFSKYNGKEIIGNKFEIDYKQKRKQWMDTKSMNEFIKFIKNEK